MKKIVLVFALLIAVNEISQAQTSVSSTGADGKSPNAAGDFKLTVVHGGTNGAKIKSTASYSVVDIDAANGDAAVRLINNGSIKWGIQNDLNTNDFHIFEFNNGSPLTILKTSGYVGIGNLAPANRLQIGPNNAFSGNDIAIGNVAGGGMSFFQSGAGVSGSSIWYSNANFALMPAGLGIGNFGIGTLTPQEKLTIQTAPGNFGLFHTDGTTSVGTYVSSTRGYFGTKSNHDLSFFTNDGTSQMIIKTSGNVGIGTAGPTAKLHVDGYTKLGLNAPAIAVAKFTGTTAATQNAAATPIVHGLTASKILSISVVVDLGGAGNVFENYTQTAGYQVGTSFEATNIYIWNSPANSANILNKPFKVLVTYEQ